MENLASKISDSELSVMNLLWESKEALSVTTIRKTLEESSEWDASTIKTLLRRLCQKGVVSAEKREVFYYTPVITKSEYNDYITQKLIDKIYSGSAKNLVASLFSDNKLKKEDIDELREMFNNNEKG